VNEILDPAGASTGIKAYSTRPGSNFSGNEGIVCVYDWFGDYTMIGSPLDPATRGNALTHEAGHYLGLWHPFDKGGCVGLSDTDCYKLGDMCCDVPPVSNQNQTCGVFNTCTESDDKLDQKENYMDYTL